MPYVSHTRKQPNNKQADETLVGEPTPEFDPVDERRKLAGKFLSKT